MVAVGGVVATTILIWTAHFFHAVVARARAPVGKKHCCDTGVADESTYFSITYIMCTENAGLGLVSTNTRAI